MYQVGDMVKIRSDIKRGNDIDPGLYVTSEMVIYAGEITKIIEEGCIVGEKWFGLEIDGGEYWWSTKMFVPLKQRTE